MARSRSRTEKLCPRHGKKILADRIAAELRLEHIQLRSRREIHDEKRAHPCEFGNGWHLTSEEAHYVSDYSHSA